MLLGGWIRVRKGWVGNGHGLQFQPGRVHFDRPFDLMEGNVEIREQKEGQISMEDKSLNL